MTRLRSALFVLLLALMTLPAQAQKQLTLEDIHASRTFSGDFFEGGRWAQDGPVVIYVERDEESGATHLMSYNLETDARTRLLDGSLLAASDVDRTIAIEDYAYSADGGTVLLYTDSAPVWRLNTKGYYYLFDVEAKTLRPLADRSKGYQMFAKLSPEGTRAAFVRDRNLFVVDLATMEETALTDDGSEGGIINGTTDWVYEEEFGLRDGWSWSPDGRYIAFVQLDETNTRDFAMADLRGQYPEFERFRYPKAGEANSEIRVGVADVASAQVRFFDTDTWNAGGDAHEYIPLLGWTPAHDGGANVWIFRLNRDQNDLDVLYGDPQTMQIRTVLNEQSETWLDVETGFSDLDVGALTYLRDGEHFIWVSERDGYRHLYLYENDGTLVRQLTSGDWDVTNFLGADEEAGIIYFVSTQESPLERHLYRQQVDLNGGDATGEPVKITQEAGWHDVNLSRDRRYYIDSHSTITQPTMVSLHRVDGSLVKVLEDNAGLIETLAEYELPAPEFTEVPGADGTMLNTMVIKPSGFDPGRKYPVLMYVYGGPGSQTVRNAWGGSRHLWHQYLAEELGVIVVSVDNRGTGGRGTAFRTATYKNLGQLEAADQIAAAQHLGTLPYVDPARIGIWGWSYGGYMTLMSMLAGEGPQTFKAGIAVAPVTDWRQYDTIYTERYMSTPQRNAAGYDAGAPVKMAENLSDDQELLIVHGDFDDNVHFQNAVQMADALQAAGKQFEMMVYPGRNHGIFGGNTRLHLHTLLTDFVEENLVGQPVPVTAPGGR